MKSLLNRKDSRSHCKIGAVCCQEKCCRIDLFTRLDIFHLKSDDNKQKTLIRLMNNRRRRRRHGRQRQKPVEKLLSKVGTVCVTVSMCCACTWNCNIFMVFFASKLSFSPFSACCVIHSSDKVLINCKQKRAAKWEVERQRERDRDRECLRYF